MGRKIGQVIWMNVSMTIGTFLGFRLSDFLFWTDDIKYKVWEETENKFWEDHGKPINLEALVKFDSVINEGTIFYSYLPSIGTYIESDYYEKYKI